MRNKQIQFNLPFTKVLAQKEPINVFADRKVLFIKNYFIRFV